MLTVLSWHGSAAAAFGIHGLTAALVALTGALVGALGKGAFEKGSAHQASEFAGVAIWLRPGVHPDPVLLGQVPEPGP